MFRVPKAAQDAKLIAAEAKRRLAERRRGKVGTNKTRQAIEENLGTLTLSTARLLHDATTVAKQNPIAKARQTVKNVKRAAKVVRAVPKIIKTGRGLRRGVGIAGKTAVKFGMRTGTTTALLQTGSMVQALIEAGLKRTLVQPQRLATKERR
jgi:hypothetical protein